RFDTGPVLDPAEAERLAGDLLRALREAEDRPEVRAVVLCTTDAMMVDGSPRVFTAGAMAAALARVATAEDRRGPARALALDPAPEDDSALHESVRTLLVHGHPHVNGVIADGRFYLPSVATDPATTSEVGTDHDAIVVFGGNSDLGHAAVEWFAAKGIR